jgi:hypothetical protein
VINGPLHHRRTVLNAAHVGVDGDRAAGTLGLQSSGELGCAGMIEIGHNDACPGLVQPLHDRLTDAHRASRHDRRAPGQVDQLGQRPAWFGILRHESSLPIAVARVSAQNHLSEYVKST